MKKHLVILFVALFTMFSSLPSFAAARWVGNSYIVVNGTWYKGSNTAGNFSVFNGNDLGELRTLSLGGELQINADNNENWNGGAGNWMGYRIENSNGTTVIADASLNMSYFKFQDNNNFVHTESATNIDLSGLTPGQTYTLVVWFGGVDNQWDSGNNFTATFTLQDTYTVTFENTGNWTSVNAYTWTGSNAKVKHVMTQVDNTNVYTATFDALPTANINFSAGDNGIQTEDLTLAAGPNYSYTVPAYRVCGDNSAIFGGWGYTEGDADINPMTLGNDGVFTWNKNDIEIAAGNLGLSFRIQVDKSYRGNNDMYANIKGIAYNWGETLPKAGTYDVTVTFDQNNKTVSATFYRHPLPDQTFTVRVVNSGNWENVYAYTFVTGDSDHNADWPGVKISTDGSKAGDFDIYTYTTPLLSDDQFPTVILFNNGDNPGVEGSTKTSNLAFENNKTYWGVTTYGLEGGDFGGWKDGSTYRGIERLFTKTNDTYTYTEKGVYFTEGEHTNSFRISVNGEWVGGTGIDGIDNNGSITVAETGIYDVLFELTPSTSTLTVTPTKISSVNISVGALGVGTFCSEYALDFTGVTAIKAYKIIGETNGLLIKEQVTGQVKAGTGLFIENGTGEAASANANVPTTNYNVDPGTNWLKGVTAATHISQLEDGHTNYILTTNGGATAKFYKVNSTTGNNVGAHKAYLHVSGAYARESMWFDNDKTTGIKNIDHSSLTIDKDAPMYNLAGQKVGANYKGIVIQNGKKLVIK